MSLLITGVRTLTRQLAAPVLSVSVSGTTATLSWTAPVPTGQSVIAGYTIAKANNPTGPFLAFDSTTLLTKAYTLTDVTYYRVQASDQFVAGQVSNVATAAVAFGTKFRALLGGHSMWPFNTDWPGAQKGVFDSIFPTLYSDTNGPAIVTLYLRWADIEAAQGDYSPAYAAIDYVLAKCKAGSRPIYLMIRGILRTFQGETNGNTSYWPLYTIANSTVSTTAQGGTGWIVNCFQTGETTVLDSQVNWGNAACVLALTKAWQAICDRYDSDPNVEMFIPHDESQYINGPGAPNSITPTVAFNAFKQMHLDIKSHAQRTLVQCSVNFLNSDPANPSLTAAEQFRQLFTDLPAAYPGGFCFGGSDPIIYNGQGSGHPSTQDGTTAQQIFRGDSGGVDYRGKLIWHEMLQGVPFTNAGNTSDATSVASGALTGANAGGSWRSFMRASYITWVNGSFANGQSYSGNFLPAMHALGGKTTLILPTQGTFDQTPGSHA